MSGARMPLAVSQKKKESHVQGLRQSVNTRDRNNIQVACLIMDINVHALVSNACFGADGLELTYFKLFVIKTLNGRPIWQSFHCPNRHGIIYESNSLPTSSAGGKGTSDFDDEKQLGIFRKVTQFLRRWGIETHG